MERIEDGGPAPVGAAERPEPAEWPTNPPVATRFRVVTVHTQRGGVHGEITEREDGEWVPHRDYQAALDEVATLRAELETERMRLAVCTAAALGNTPEAVAQRLPREHPYWSASYGDVCAAVDREMALRARLTQLETALGSLVALYGPDTDYHHVIEPHAWAEILALLTPEGT